MAQHPVASQPNQSPDWSGHPANWFNSTLGSGWSETAGGVMHYGLTTVISDEILANTSDDTLLTGTIIVSVPTAVGIVVGGEVLLGVGTYGGTTGTAVAAGSAVVGTGTGAGTVVVGGGTAGLTVGGSGGAAAGAGGTGALLGIQGEIAATEALIAAMEADIVAAEAAIASGTLDYWTIQMLETAIAAARVEIPYLNAHIIYMWSFL